VDPELPQVFVRLRDFVRNDLKQMLKIEDGAPNYAAALLITIASETLSKLLGHVADRMFAQDLLGKHGVPLVVARGLFDAVRNGIAHVYDTKTILIEGQPIFVVVSWRSLPHARVLTRDWLHEGVARRGVCLNVHTMWADLNSYLERLEQRLRTDERLRRDVMDWSRRVETTVRPEGEAVDTWKAFIESAAGK
jgi:hypothetical protein